MCVHAPNLTRYHMKMVLKAFSLEQEPQAMVMSWDIPLGATCRERNSCGLSFIWSLPPSAGVVPLWAASWPWELWAAEGDWEGTRDVPEAVGLGEWTWAHPGVAEEPRSPEAGGRTGKKGKGKPSLSLLMQLPPLETSTFCRWEVEVLNDFNHCNN